jgi:hypothetical protein
MALLTAQAVSDGGSGITPTYSAASSSDTVAFRPGLWLHVKNTNGATRDIAVVIPGTHISGQANPDVAHTIAATTGDRLIPIPNAASDQGVVTFTTSATAGVTWGVFYRELTP